MKRQFVTGAENLPPCRREFFKWYMGIALTVTSFLSAELKELVHPFPKSLRVSASHTEAGGIGYGHGYTSLELFLSPPEPARWGIPFFNLRGHISNNGKPALNAGIGYRYLSDCSWVYGINAFYDFRNAHRENYNQFGVGFEALGSRFEFRANGYFPVGRTTDMLSSSKTVTPYEFFTFKGNEALLQQTTRINQRFQQAYTGCDAEMGAYLLPDCIKYNIYVGIGPYYFQGGHGKAALGAKARLSMRISSYLTLEATDSWDRVFKNRPQGLISFNYPFGPKVRNSCLCAPSGLYQNVERQEIIVLKQYRKKTVSHIEQVAIDPATGQPIDFIFVNNTSSSKGTFESPYSTLLLAQNNSKPGDTIYVYAGDGTTMGMDQGITLQNQQKFWGSGTAQKMQTQFGTITIPAQTSDNPQITNLRGNGVTLAHNNEVSGFFITSPTENVTINTISVVTPVSAGP